MNAHRSSTTDQEESNTLIDDDSVFNILIATDIHLGYAEKSPGRGNDSFNTFEEILKIALERQVDFVLLGGDLFHENKPSRSAEIKCIDILQRHILGDKPIGFEVVSDPERDFAHCSGGPSSKHVNFMNNNINIGLPIFSIHGNHDDPAGLGSFSVLDSLHSMGYINYFGKVNVLDRITLSPMLFQKGGSGKLALYGMGSIKDERLHRLFRGGKVDFLRPDESTENWFNLLVVHQNRIKHGETNYLPAHMINSFIDLVFWGHEHECRIDPERVEAGNSRFYITQPGSSVATSLCPAEAVPKCVGLMKIHKREFNIEKIPLQTVRPMLFRSLALDDPLHGLKLPSSSHLGDNILQSKISNFLQTYVSDLIKSDEYKELLTGHVSQPKKPLVRVRVFYSDDRHTLLPGKFGNMFDSKVANPSDILLFKKLTVRRKGDPSSAFDSALLEKIMSSNISDKSANETGGNTAFGVVDNILSSHSGDDIKLETFIKSYFETVKQEESGSSSLKSPKSHSTQQLMLLDVDCVANFVEKFIVKDDKECVMRSVDDSVKSAVTWIQEQRCSDQGEMSDSNIIDEDFIDSMLKEYRLSQKSKNLS